MSEEKSYRLRIPEALYAEMERIAHAEQRSVNGQIIKFLQEAIAEWKAANPSRGIDEQGYTEEKIEALDLLAA